VKELHIGELARLFGLAPNVLRHWEAAQLLSPAARVNGRRRYGQEHVTRVAMIIMGQEAGLTLDDVREVFKATDPSVRRALLERHVRTLEARLAAIQSSKQTIEHALDCPMFDDYKWCPSCQLAIAALRERYAHASNPTESERHAGRRLAHHRLRRTRRG
jgi:MerR family copper efflux transcriptional regulator